jgi:hypothetical protein
VRVDGVLNEPVWRQATRLTGFWQYLPVDGRPAEEKISLPGKKVEEAVTQLRRMLGDIRTLLIR